jgi:hypothetical protein
MEVCNNLIKAFDVFIRYIVRICPDGQLNNLIMKLICLFEYALFCYKEATRTKMGI